MAMDKDKYFRSTFYVFYDAEDNIMHCGTAEQLIEEGAYKNYGSICSHAYKIKKGIRPGHVVVLK